MTSSSLTAPKLRLKPLFLIGAIVVLAGLLLNVINHLCTITFIGDGSFLNISVNTPLFQYFRSDSFSSSFVFFPEGNLLEWLVYDTVYFLLPAVSTLLNILAVVLFGVYVVGAYRAKRGTALLSLSLMLTAGSAAWSVLFFNIPSYLFGFFYPVIIRGDFSRFGDCLHDLLTMLTQNAGLWLGWGVTLLLAGAVLVAAVTLLVSPRWGKVVAIVLLCLHTLLLFAGLITTCVNLVSNLVTSLTTWFFAAGDYVSLSLSGFLAPPVSGAVLLFFVLFILLLITNRLQPVFGKQQPTQELVAEEAADAAPAPTVDETPDADAVADDSAVAE